MKIMRWLTLLCGLLTTAVLADTPLSGFKYIYLPPQASAAYYRDFSDYFSSQLIKRTDFENFPHAEFGDLSNADDSIVTIRCALSYTLNESTFTNRVEVVCVDFQGKIVFEDRRNSTGGMVARGDVKSGLRGIAKKIAKARPRFVAEHALKGRASNEYADLDLDNVGQLFANRRLDPIEGIWMDQDSTYELVIVADTNEPTRYIAVVVSSDNPLWKPNMVKAEFRRTAGGNSYISRYLDAVGGETRGIAKVSADTLHLPKDVGPYYKIGISSSVELQPTPQLAGSGSGFLVSDGVIATNHHVVASAKSIEVCFQNSQRCYEADTLIADSTNDLALVKIRDWDKLAAPLPIRNSQGIKAGLPVNAGGFPLGEFLGDSIKVTDGVISSLSGIEGNPTMYQITCPIQPGNSGGPLLTSSNEVVGIVVAQANTLYVARNFGTIPQNINFAVKADYLEILSRQAGISLSSTNNSDPLASIAKVKAYR